jgi:hypothetical protein
MLHQTNAILIAPNLTSYRAVRLNLAAPKGMGIHWDELFCVMMRRAPKI